ncbi:MAG TPA: hypothetical protein VLF69_01875 [Candidatus Saccharimonadales bacterium]|nr:hypothetical protein [Candidatus Saccharimonadales bacterium]
MAEIEVSIPREILPTYSMTIFRMDDEHKAGDEVACAYDSTRVCDVLTYLKRNVEGADTLGASACRAVAEQLPGYLRGECINEGLLGHGEEIAAAALNQHVDGLPTNGGNA